MPKNVSNPELSLKRYSLIIIIIIIIIIVIHEFHQVLNKTSGPRQLHNVSPVYRNKTSEKTGEKNYRNFSSFSSTSAGKQRTHPC